MARPSTTRGIGWCHVAGVLVQRDDAVLGARTLSGPGVFEVARSPTAARVCGRLVRDSGTPCRLPGRETAGRSRWVVQIARSPVVSGKCGYTTCRVDRSADSRRESTGPRAKRCDADRGDWVAGYCGWGRPGWSDRRGPAMAWNPGRMGVGILSCRSGPEPQSGALAPVHVAPLWLSVEFRDGNVHRSGGWMDAGPLPFRASMGIRRLGALDAVGERVDLPWRVPFRRQCRPFRGGRRVDPRFLEGHHYLAEAAARRGDLGRASDHFEAALKFRDDTIAYVDWASAASSLAGIRLQQERYDEADRLLVKIQEGVTGTKAKRIIYNRAVVAERQKRYVDVVDLLSNEGWNRPEPVMLLARSLSALGKINEAIAQLERAVPMLDTNRRHYVEDMIQSMKGER